MQTDHTVYLGAGSFFDPNFHRYKYVTGNVEPNIEPATLHI